MKKALALALLLAVCFGASAQKPEIVKKGINFGPLPAIGYSSDLGWHYGALTDIYWYGDGSTYPEYMWKANVEASWYSKGNSVYHAFFDSKYIIPGLRVAADISYFGNKTSDFYGFNGAASRYVPELATVTKDPCQPAGQGFYLMRRDIFRVMGCLQGTFGDSHWGWAGGVTFLSIRTGPAENKGITDNRPDVSSLYGLYVKHGVIPEAEKFGGRHLEFKGGVVFDTRDHENNPTKGTNIEAYLYGSPDIISKHDNSYLGVAFHFKQFFPLVKDKLVFGGHLAYQGIIAGNIPFYMLQTIETINPKQINPEGLGSTCTLRGTVNNRLRGRGYAWSNFELRYSFARFTLFNQNFILALNPFFDAGLVVQPYRLEEMKKLSADKSFVSKVVGKDGKEVEYFASDFYTGQAEKLHMGAGAGLHVIMNQNFNINFEFGKCFDKNDGTGLGINVGLNYIF